MKMKRNTEMVGDIKPRRDMNGIMKALIFMGFSAFYIYALVSGSVRQYVHPRIDPYLIFSAAVMWVIAGLYVLEHIKSKPMKNPLSRSNYKIYLFYIIPLIMAFTLQPRNINMNSGTISVGGTDLSSQESQSSSSVQNVDENKSEETESSQETAIELRNGVIVMDEEHFYAYMNEIYANPNPYVGLPIEVVGAVFKDESQFGPNQFVPSRNLMTCCAADTVSIGLLCQYEEADQLEPGVWVKVRGILELSDFNGEAMPMIQVESVEVTEKPMDEFIYPY